MGRKRYWTYERCYEEALKYNSRTTFQKGNHSAYTVARLNGWLDDYKWFKKSHTRESKWKDNYDACYQEALKYKTRWDFAKGCMGAYAVALANGWLDDYKWFERPVNLYKDKKDNVYAYVFEPLNSIYIGRSVHPITRDKEHRKSTTSSVFKFSQENNVSIPVMIILENNLTPIEGLEKEDYYVNKYKEEGWVVINRAKTGVNSGSLGGVAKKWTKKKCYQEALKYKTRWDFGKGSKGAYAVARLNGWLDDYKWFDEPDKTPKKVFQYTLDNKLVATYNGSREAARKVGINQQNISACCLGKTKKAKGYQWLYLDGFEKLLIKKMIQNIANKGIVLRKTA